MQVARHVCTKLAFTAARTYSAFSAVQDGVLYINLTDECNSVTSLSLRGPGFRLSPERKFAPLFEEPTAAHICDAVEAAYAKHEIQDIVFDNILGEPLLRLDVLLEASSLIKKKRHGVPLTIRTNGLCGSKGAEQLSTADPGDNFGFKNLHVEVALQAHSPLDYQKIMLPQVATVAFSNVCSYLVRIVELIGGESVTCTVIKSPGVQTSSIQQLASSLEVGHFSILPFFPHDYYDLLAVDVDASMEEIKGAFRELAMSLHPDKNQGADPDVLNRLAAQFTRVNTAFETLTDPIARHAYDMSSAVALEHKRDELRRKQQQT